MPDSRPSARLFALVNPRLDGTDCQGSYSVHDIGLLPLADSLIADADLRPELRLSESEAQTERPQFCAGHNRPSTMEAHSNMARTPAAKHQARYVIPRSDGLIFMIYLLSRVSVCRDAPGSLNCHYSMRADIAKTFFILFQCRLARSLL